MTNYQASVVVGLPYYQIKNPDIIKDKLKIFSSCIGSDSDKDSTIAGIECLSDKLSDDKPYVWNQAYVELSRQRFKEMTGQDGKVWINPIN